MNAQDVYIQPGELHFGGGTTRIRTLLGSCVAITLWHPTRRIGGMCHYMLPRQPMNARCKPGYYGDQVMTLFLEEINAAGTQLKDYQAKLFGGGRMFHYPAPPGGDVATQNAAMALTIAGQHKLDVRGKDLGGSGYRQVHFELWSGDVWQRRVEGAQPGMVV